MRAAVGLLSIAAPAVLFAQPVLRYKLSPGSTFGYKVAVLESNFPGNRPTPERTNSTQTPIRLKVLAASGAVASLEVTQGPLSIKGRSVGRARTSTEEIAKAGNANDQPPASMFVCLPAGGVKMGRSWKANFFAGPPIPAGMQATYTYMGITDDGRFAVVSLALEYTGASKVKGKGTLFLRLSDGVLSYGTAKLDVLHIRPDPNDRSKMKVNERVEFKYSITTD